MSDTKEEIKEEKQEKVVTRYDKRMERRKKEKEAQKRRDNISKIIGIAVLVAIIAFIASFPIRKLYATYSTYIIADGEKMTRAEYDYYYYVTKSNYVNNYGSYMSYFGVDFDGDLSAQPYSENMTWKDLMDEQTVDSIKQTKALKKEIAAAGFTYDTTDEFNEYKEVMQTVADTLGKSLKDYVKEQYGPYATLNNIAPYLKDSMVINQFYNEKLATLEPTDAEVESYYQENKIRYDLVDYRMTEIEAELSSEAPTDDEIAKAMTAAEPLATAALETIDKDGELTEGASYYDFDSTDVSSWLYDETRAAGETTVIRDDNFNKFYCVEFIKRYKNEAPDEATGEPTYIATIKNLLASNAMQDYLDGIAEPITIEDPKDNLKYEERRALDEASTEESEPAVEVQAVP